MAVRSEPLARRTGREWVMAPVTPRQSRGLHRLRGQRCPARSGRSRMLRSSFLAHRVRSQRCRSFLFTVVEWTQHRSDRLTVVNCAAWRHCVRPTSSCSHRHRPSLELSIFPDRSPVPIKPPLSIPRPAAPAATGPLSASCIRGLLFAHVTSCEWSHSVCPFVTGAFHDSVACVGSPFLSKARQHVTVRAPHPFIRAPVTDARAAPPSNAAYKCPSSRFHCLRVRTQKWACWVTALLAWSAETSPSCLAQLLAILLGTVHLKAAEPRQPEPVP